MSSRFRVFGLPKRSVMVLAVIVGVLSSARGQETPRSLPQAEGALHRLIEAQRSGDLDAYAAALAEPVGPVFKRSADSATKVGQAKRQLIQAAEKKFGPSANDDHFDYATDDSQQRAILQRLVDIKIDDSMESGDLIKMHVTTTIRMPDGSSRQIPQTFQSIEQRGVWKIEDLAILGHLAAQKKIAETNWEIFRGFNRLTLETEAGRYPSRAALSAAARAVYDHATGVNVPPPPGDEPFKRGSALYKSGDLAGAFTLFLEAANAGHPYAQCQVAIQYSNGEIVKKDDAQAAAWYRKSADQGNPLAQNDLGSMLLEGDGVPADPNEGMRLLLLSAEQDHDRAFTNIGRAYLFGFGVPKDFGKAMDWFDKAAALGNDQAAYFTKWLKAAPGNRAFKNEHQAEVFKQLQLMRAKAFEIELGGRGIDGYYHYADPQGAAALRAQADELARQNGLE